MALSVIDSAGRVRGRRAERAVVMTNADEPESMDRLQGLLRLFGVTKALERAGVQPGDQVWIGDIALTWGD